MNQVSKETGLFIACVAGTAAVQTCGTQAGFSVLHRGTKGLKDPRFWGGLLVATTAADLLAAPLVAAAEVYERNRRQP